jgi:hypothetical protein
MNRFVSMLVLVAFLVVPFGAAAELRAGAASIDINPADGTFLGGYGKNRKSTGVHDNLYAKAVVFDDGTTPIALVILDSVGTQYDTIQAIRKRASALTKAVSIPPERIIVCSTHTHCSPDNIGIYGPDDTTTGRDEKYLAEMTEKAAAQVAAAAEALQPIDLVWATTTGGDWAVNDCEPGVVDKVVTVLQCLGADKKPVATLTSFACHPTVLDGKISEVSSDWVGSFYTDMAAALPGEHLFLQGCIGGWIQPETPARTFPLAKKYGSDLATRTLEAAAKSKPVKGEAIRFANKVFQMPNENPAFKAMAELKLVPRPMGDHIETEVAWFAVGDAQFATHPGETAPTFGWQTKALMDSAPRVVLGLGLDQLGYILRPDYFVDPESIPHAPYLTRTSAGPSAGPAMMDALKAIIP